MCVISNVPYSSVLIKKMYVFDKDSFGSKKMSLLIYQEGFLHSLHSDNTCTVMYYMIRTKDGE